LLVLFFVLAAFQFLKLVVPGAFFAEDFGVVFYFRAFGFFGLGVEDDFGVFQIEVEGFVLIIRVFDEKIEAAANRTLHFFYLYIRQKASRKGAKFSFLRSAHLTFPTSKNKMKSGIFGQLTVGQKNLI
jgi:hypothetical protein